MYYSLLSLKMIPFVLFRQASEPSVNFKILKLVYWKVFTGITTKFSNYTAVVLLNQTWMALKSFPWNLLITVKPEDTSLSSNHATGVRKSRGFASPLAPAKSWQTGSKSWGRQVLFGVCKCEILQQNNAIF